MVAVTPTRQPSAAMSRGQVADDVLDVMENGLAGVTFRETTADVRWFDDALTPPRYTGTDFDWTNGPTWGRTQISAAPGLAAVAYIRGYGVGHWTVDTAVKVLDYAVSVQLPSGDFINDGTPNSGFVVGDFGEAIPLLRGKVAQAKIDAWTASMVAGAQWLWDHEQAWYANGNLELCDLLAFELTYRVTRDATWATRREAQYEWTVSPDPAVSSSATGHSLVYVQRPRRADGRDGKAFLTEDNGGNPDPPGYDPAYTQLQLGNAVRWWQYSRDPRALRIVNLLHNQLMDRVNTTTWLLDATGGTRLNTTDPWWTPATPMLVWGGHRPDIEATRPASVWAGVHGHFRSARTAPAETMFRAVSNYLAAWLRAAGTLPTRLA